MSGAADLEEMAREDLVPRNSLGENELGARSAAPDIRYEDAEPRNSSATEVLVLNRGGGPDSENASSPALSPVVTRVGNASVQATGNDDNFQIDTEEQADKSLKSLADLSIEVNTLEDSLAQVEKAVTDLGARTVQLQCDLGIRDGIRQIGLVLIRMTLPCALQMDDLKLTVDYRREARANLPQQIELSQMHINIDAIRSELLRHGPLLDKMSLDVAKRKEVDGVSGATSTGAPLPRRGEVIEGEIEEPTPEPTVSDLELRVSQMRDKVRVMENRLLRTQARVKDLEDLKQGKRFSGDQGSQNEVAEEEMPVHELSTVPEEPAAPVTP